MRSINKITALILSAALATSLTPTFPDMGIKAYADTAGETVAPSVQAYADVDTLTRDIFTPSYNEDGSFDSDNTKLAKLKFGKNESGNAQEWYILGKDDQVRDEKGNTDNIAIFAANNITNAKFHGGTSWYPYKGDDDEAYVTPSEKPIEVHANHYGESDIREVLRKMAGEEEDTSKDYDKYFTTIEKKMLQKTKVLSHEYSEYSTDHLYTTNDKLYLASGTMGKQGYIYVGSVSKSDSGYKVANEYTSIKLNNEHYWKSNNKDIVFWSRTQDGDQVLIAITNSGIFASEYSTYSLGVRPASNLNLKDVLFASAAEAASVGESGVAKTIDIGTETAPNAAMTLRLDGNEKDIGTVAITDNKIFVKRGSTAGKVSLVVQGKYFNESDASKNTDWYFSKLIEGNGTTAVSTDDIKAALDAASIDSAVGASVDLDNCKVWLEIPLGDGSTLSYAVQATDHTHEYSTSKWASDADKHWHECTKADCLDPDKGKKDAVAHDYGNDDTLYYDETYHYKKCIVCESTASIKADTKAAHTLGADGICTTCGYDIRNVHTLEQVDEVEPTCTSVGYKSYYRCKDNGCDVKYRSALGILIRFTDMSEMELTKTEHVEGDSYSHDSSNHWLTCVSCGAPLKKASHKLSSEYTSDDENHWQQCSVCGEATAKESHHYNGNTCVTCGYQKPEANTNTETKTETNTSTTRSSSGSHHDSADVTDNQRGRWVQDEKGWYFRRDDGSYPKSGWTKLKWLGKEYWYYFDENGYMKLGWLDVNGSRYYLNPVIGTNSGKMLTGWQQIENQWYYFSTETGAKEGSLLRNTVTPDNYRVDENGIWQQ